MTKRPTICLCMIVKDEAAVIGRCLASVLPLIDTWLVVDTGSTDHTAQVVTDLLGTKPGSLVHRPWVDFATNRSEALSLARSKAEYTLVIDADDMLVIESNLVLPPLTLDAYDLQIRLGDVYYQRPQLFSNRLPWCYRGVLHEFADAPGAGHRETLPGITMVCGQDGARRKDGATYAKDAQVLTNALNTETDPLLQSRYTFYLAQSYRDCGNISDAIFCYMARTEMGQWDEEIYISWLNVGRLMQRISTPQEHIAYAFMQAIKTCPHRAEAVYEYALYLRSIQRFADAYAIACAGRHLTTPVAGLFVEPAAYQYALLDELAISAYWSGHYADCARTCLDLLAGNHLPLAYKSRVLDNAIFAVEKLGEKS